MRAGELLVLRDMEVAIEARPDFLVCPTLYGLGHHADLGIHDQLEFGALFWGDRGVIERHRFGNGHPVAILFDDVKHPTAERLSYRSPGEHGEKVAAAKGEDADPDGQIDRAEVFNHLRHLFGEFIGVAFVDAPDRIFILVTKRPGKLRRAEPRLIVEGYGGEGEVIKAKFGGHEANSVCSSWHRLRMTMPGVRNRQTERLAAFRPKPWTYRQHPASEDASIAGNLSQKES